MPRNGSFPRHFERLAQHAHFALALATTERVDISLGSAHAYVPHVGQLAAERCKA